MNCSSLVPSVVVTVLLGVTIMPTTRAADDAEFLTILERNTKAVTAANLPKDEVTTRAAYMAMKAREAVKQGTHSSIVKSSDGPPVGIYRPQPKKTGSTTRAALAQRLNQEYKEQALTGRSDAEAFAQILIDHKKAALRAQKSEVDSYRAGLSKAEQHEFDSESRLFSQTLSGGATDYMVISREAPNAFIRYIKQKFGASLDKEER